MKTGMIIPIEIAYDDSTKAIKEWTLVELHKLVVW
jgi:hypothetical protein